MDERSNVSTAEPDGTQPTLAAAGESDLHNRTMSTDRAPTGCSIDAPSLPLEQRFRQVAPLTWQIDGAAPTAQEEVELAEQVHAQGGTFLISRNHYIDVRRVCRCKAQFQRWMAALREPRAASELAAAATHAGWQLAEYLLELARTEDETCFDLLRAEPKVLQEVQLRQAFVHGSSTSVESRYDEEEERFPSGEHARAAQQRRTAFIARLRDYLDRQFGTRIDQQRSTIDRVSEQIAKEWAQDWFAGAAYCPRCRSDDLLAITSSSSDYASIVETWTCGCGHSWKIEFQETAATANADAEPVEWIERYGSSATGKGDRPRPLSSEARSTLNAAITRLCDASFACGEWTRDSDEPRADVYREGVAARLALEALCARAFQETDVSG